MMNTTPYAPIAPDRATRGALALLMCALLSACAVGPDYKRPDVAVPAAYKELPGWTQADPDADTAAYDTVLNLFHDPAGVDGLTEWDESYLLALYKVQDAPVLRANHAAQAGDVASVMTRDQRRAAAARPEAK